MDIEYRNNGIHFIWDYDKERKNIAKHDGIGFKQASTAFFDPFLKLVDASQNNEVRDAVIGMDEQWNVLFVVHVQIKDDLIRIISARKATPKQRKNYEN